jgi:hypothetical protein
MRPPGRAASERCTRSSTARNRPRRDGRRGGRPHRALSPATMARLGIDYDLLTWEGDILRLQFWATAFEIAQAERHGVPPGEGRLGLLGHDRRRRRPHRGMAPTRDAPDPAAGRGGRRPRQREKVIVRSERHGDLCRQGHRQPVLEVRPARARLPLSTSSPRARRISTCGPPARPVARRSSGVRRGGRVYNVIDTRQAYLQKLLKQALATMGHRTRPSTRTLLLRDGGALARTARELGYDADADGKPSSRCRAARASA